MPRGGPPARHGREASGECPLRPKTVGVRPRSGWVPHPFRPRRATGQGGGERRGAAGRARRAVHSPGKTVPRPESATSHRSAAAGTTPAAAKKGARRGQRQGLRFSLARETPPRAEKQGSPAQDAHQPARRPEASGFARGRDRKSGFWSRPKRPRDPGPPITRGQHVHTYLPGKTLTVPSDGASVYRSHRDPRSWSRPQRPHKTPSPPKKGGGGTQGRDGAIWSTPKAC